jgi:hypothetical protein
MPAYARATERNPNSRFGLGRRLGSGAARPLATQHCRLRLLYEPSSSYSTTSTLTSDDHLLVPHVDLAFWQDDHLRPSALLCLCCKRLRDTMPGRRLLTQLFCPAAVARSSVGIALARLGTKVPPLLHRPESLILLLGGAWLQHDTSALAAVPLKSN